MVRANVIVNPGAAIGEIVAPGQEA